MRAFPAENKTVDLPNLSALVSSKFAYKTANAIVLSHCSLSRVNEKSSSVVLGHGGPELTATSRAQSAPLLYVDAVAVSSAST